MRAAVFYLLAGAASVIAGFTLAAQANALQHEGHHVAEYAVGVTGCVLIVVAVGLAMTGLVKGWRKL